MSEVKLPVITGDNFQILKATQEKGVWRIRAALGDVEKNVEVLGTAEHVLQVMSTLSELSDKVASLRDRARFIVKNGKILGGGITATAKRVHPFHVHLFQRNS